MIVQDTCPTYADATWRFLKESITNLPENGPAFQKAHGTKLGRYSALISVAQRLVDDRKLNFRPKFLFPVLSSLGIMNADMKQLMKVMVDRFKDNQKGQPSSIEGIGASVLKGRFKMQLKNAICFAFDPWECFVVVQSRLNGG